MRKSALKRIRITKTGKLMHRRPGHNHLNAKAPRRKQMRRASLGAFSGPLDKQLRAYLNH